MLSYRVSVLLVYKGLNLLGAILPALVFCLQKRRIQEWTMLLFELATSAQLRDRAGFVTYFLNSVILSTLATLMSIATSVLAGYAFSRFRFPAKRALLVFILASQMFPLVLLLVAIFVLFRQLTLLYTYLRLSLAFTSFPLPFCIWMMRGFFDTVPRELEQAAMIDGAARLQALFRVVLPLVGPGVIAVGLFSLKLGTICPSP